MTYTDAAERLGIKIASVKRQARAKSWPRRSMNDGTVQVCIPPDRLTDHPPPIPPENPQADSGADLSARLAVAEIRAELAEKRADEIARDRDAWRAQAERLASEPRASSLNLIERIFGRKA